LGAAALAIVLCGYLACLAVVMREMVDGYRVVARNFYGLLRVEDEGNPKIDQDANRKLVHGTINHGEQFLREPYRRQPVTYFCPQSGIGLAMQAQEGPPRRIGILGLGCGTLAAYGRPGDTLRIYEINPLVLDIARSEFTYLRDTPARVEVALGDGRLLLESEPSQQFDLLVMDAFSGDSVPVHLITREAFGTYFRHLKPSGILAVNITNTYLDLRPVVERAAAAFGKVALVYDYTPDENDFQCFQCSWSLIMDRATATAHPGLQGAGKVLRQERPFRIWTDDFSNMFSILR
jgi:predicted O-methyltransferase YrrM